MISVLLADDHPLVLSGLRRLLEAQPDIRIAGEETDGLKVCESVRRLKPDVLVLDLVMPNLSGIEILRQLNGDASKTRVVVLSMHSEIAYVWEALRNGAAGYVVKCADVAELLRAVRAAGTGQRYLSTPLAQDQIENYGRRMREPGVDPYETLTRRERQVLRLVAEGKTSVEIGAQLEIGVRTVESHRASLLRKLDLHNQSELVRYAIQHGLIFLG